MKATSTNLAIINRQIERVYPGLGAKLDAKEYSAAVTAANQSLAGKSGFDAILYPTNMGGKVGVNLRTKKVFSAGKLIREMNRHKQTTWVEFERVIKKSSEEPEGQQSSSQSAPTKKSNEDDRPITTSAVGGREQIPDWLRNEVTRPPKPHETYNPPAPAPPGTEQHWLSSRHG